MALLKLRDTLLIGSNDLLKNLLDVVVVLGNGGNRSFNRLINEAIISSVLHDEINKI